MDCYLRCSQHSEANDLYVGVLSQRNIKLGMTHPDTVRAVGCLGICHAQQGRHAEAEAAFLDAVSRQKDFDARLLDNLCKALWNQGKWQKLESMARQSCEIDHIQWSSAH